VDRLILLPHTTALIEWYLYPSSVGLESQYPFGMRGFESPSLRHTPSTAKG